MKPEEGIAEWCATQYGGCQNTFGQKSKFLLEMDHVPGNS
jgi:hypothetical protein